MLNASIIGLWPNMDGVLESTAMNSPDDLWLPRQEKLPALEAQLSQLK